MERDGSPVPFERVLRDIKERDQHDMTRDIDPMVDDPDRFGYVSIDNTHFTPEQTLEEALRVIKEKGITV